MPVDGVLAVIPFTLQSKETLMNTSNAVSNNNDSKMTFDQLNLRPEVLQALSDLGMKNPTSIQESAIPALLKGKDLIGQAKTGTGKTLAFAAPALSLIDPNCLEPQVIILAPTRELALQVSEAVQSYASHLRSVEVLAIYGGQNYRAQFKSLKDGVQIIVGTPGRVMDMIERKALDLSSIKFFVLDEADEMLKMGFIDDVAWILEKAPDNCQRALFSATMPPEIKKVATRYLRDPEHIQVSSQERTTSSIEQYYSVMHWEQKTTALCRFLTLEHSNATIIFTRTKNDSSELAEKLIAKGYKAAAINGDMNQPVREKVIQNLKSGVLDIVVATDVAARGLDVERIDMVVNFDIPFDVESYVHRIGRTGRAGRTGKALSLLGHKDLRMLKLIQRQTGYTITEVSPPSIQKLKAHAQKQLASQLKETLEKFSKNPDQKLINTQILELQAELGCDLESLAAALLTQKLDSTFGSIEEFAPSTPRMPSYDRESRDRDPRAARNNDRNDRNDRGGDRGDRSNASNSRGRFDRNGAGAAPSAGNNFSRNTGSAPRKAESGMISCVMSMGKQDDIRPSDIVGFIANRCNIDRKMIGRIEIEDRQSRVDINESIAKTVVSQLGQTKFKRQPVSFTLA
jgi:ATP-dependent RNA helicase DeaD